MDQSRFIRGLLDDPADPQQPQYVPANDFGPRAYGLLNTLFPDPYEAVPSANSAELPGDEAHAFNRQQGIGVEPEPGLKRYPESWRDKVASTIAGDASSGSYRRGVVERLIGSSGLGHTVYGLADMPVIGNLLGANDAYVNNDLNGVFLNALGLATFPVKMPMRAKAGLGLSLTGAKALNNTAPSPAVDKKSGERP